MAPDLWKHVRNERYDALWLHGHNFAAHHVAFAAAKSIGAPVLMRAETHLGLPSSTVKRLLRRPLMGAFYSACDGFLAIGSANKAYYRAMGVPDEKISLVPYSVDNARFMRMSRLTTAKRRLVRDKLGISQDRPAVLYASKFMQRKRPDDLIRAAQMLTAEGLAFDLVMVGSGDMDAELRELVATGGPRRTVFPGFINQQELPSVFGACDIFVLPSENEPWGLIVNEAMCAGLPVVLSESIGCAPDLLREGENGYGFKAGDIDALTTSLRRILMDADLRNSMSIKSLDIIAGWSHQKCLEGIREQLAAISSRGRLRQKQALRRGTLQR
jgi:glycosyltransferase involved in cell wall biosynthesis